MIEYCMFRIKLFLLTHAQDKIYAAYKKDISKLAKDDRRSYEVERISSESQFEHRMQDEEIAIHITNYLCRKAKRHFVPIPPFSVEGMWDRCSIMSDQYILTSRGIFELRSALRKERNEKIEFILKISAALTGVIGALTGLIAILNVAFFK